MNRSYSKIRNIQRANIMLENSFLLKKLLNEQLFLNEPLTDEEKNKHTNKWYYPLIKPKSANELLSVGPNNIAIRYNDGTVNTYSDKGYYNSKLPSGTVHEGTWESKPDGGYIVKTNDGDSYDTEIGKWYSQYSAGTTNQNSISTSDATTTSSVSSGGAAIPSGLDNVEGVKKFQTWLDTNHPGWHSKYGTLGDNLGKGWGKYGPNTKRAWSTYQTEYSKVSNTTPTDDGP